MRISIIVPVYNAEKYIRRCVDSLIGQTYKELEILLIHTESGDQAGKICDDYAKRDNRVKVVHNRETSISGARNTGLSLSTGEYILFVDSDDWLEENCCGEIIRKGMESQADIVIFDFYRNTGMEEMAVHLFKSDSLVWEGEEIKQLQLDLLTGKYDPQMECGFGNNLTAVWGKLFKRSVVTGKAAFYEVERAEDLLFDLEAFAHAFKVVYIRENYYHYRVIKTSTSWRFHEFDDYSVFNKVWEAFIKREAEQDRRFRDGLEMRKAGQMTGILQGSVFHPDNPDSWQEKRRKYYLLRKEYLPSICYVLDYSLEGKPRKYLLWTVRHNCFMMSYLLCMWKRRVMFR